MGARERGRLCVARARGRRGLLLLSVPEWLEFPPGERRRRWRAASPGRPARLGSAGTGSRERGFRMAGTPPPRLGRARWGAPDRPGCACRGVRALGEPAAFGGGVNRLWLLRQRRRPACPGPRECFCAVTATPRASSGFGGHGARTRGGGGPAPGSSGDGGPAWRCARRGCEGRGSGAQAGLDLGATK